MHSSMRRDALAERHAPYSAGQHEARALSALIGPCAKSASLGLCGIAPSAKRCEFATHRRQIFARSCLTADVVRNMFCALAGGARRARGPMDELVGRIVSNVG